MSNMSYCRFTNTLGDLGDCEDALAETFDTPDWDKVGDAEKRAAKRLIEMCRRIADDYGNG